MIVLWRTVGRAVSSSSWAMLGMPLLTSIGKLEGEFKEVHGALERSIEGNVEGTFGGFALASEDGSESGRDDKDGLPLGPSEGAPEGKNADGCCETEGPPVGELEETAGS